MVLYAVGTDRDGRAASITGMVPDEFRTRDDGWSSAQQPGEVVSSPSQKTVNRCTNEEGNSHQDRHETAPETQADKTKSSHEPPLFEIRR